ncbi:MAG: hypothetical protein RL210_2089 [Pseudomonadota bacterium]|jgi:hypothetical protein
MTMKRYNYLPHPISEYGPFRSRPDDDATMLLARKDQAAWNFGYLLYPPRYEAWHKVSALPSNQEAIALDACLLMHHKVIQAAFEGVTVRDQILQLPPDEFVTWFNAIGGLYVIEGYGRGGIRVGDTHVAALQDFIPYTLKKLVATEI